jgi:hypothetical protein
MTAADCLAALAAYRESDRCRRCEYLDWAIAQLQQVGDYDLACEAAALRAPRDRVESAADCRPCPPLDLYFGWLREAPPGVSEPEYPNGG